MRRPVRDERSPRTARVALLRRLPRRLRLGLWRARAWAARRARRLRGHGKERDVGGLPRPARPTPALAPWLVETADRQSSWRAGSLARWAPSSEEAGVTVVCVTNRPHQLDEVVANYERQQHPHRQLLVVTNSRAFDLEAVRARLAVVEGASTIDIDEDASLGSCLNVALERCRTRSFAKFDDDDWYGPHFLTDLVLAQRFADAAVVGKHSYFVHLLDGDVRLLRFPGREFVYTSFVAGGTLLVDTSRTGHVRFADRSVGEDSAFLEACLRRGQSVFGADRFNYVQRRGADNTWQAGSDALTAGAAVVDPASPAGAVEV